MSGAITCGQILNMNPTFKRNGFFVEDKLTLPEYIREKVQLLHELGHSLVTERTFNGCANEIQVDNRARTIIFNR